MRVVVLKKMPCVSHDRASRDGLSGQAALLVFQYELITMIRAKLLEKQRSFNGIQ